MTEIYTIPEWDFGDTQTELILKRLTLDWLFLT